MGSVACSASGSGRRLRNRRVHYVFVRGLESDRLATDPPALPGVVRSGGDLARPVGSFIVHHRAESLDDRSMYLGNPNCLSRPMSSRLRKKPLPIRFFCGARNVTPTGSAFGAAGYLAPNGRLVVRGSAASDAGLSLSCNEKRPPRRLFPHSKLRRLAGNRACSV